MAKCNLQVFFSFITLVSNKTQLIASHEGEKNFYVGSIPEYNTSRIVHLICISLSRWSWHVS